MSDVNYYKINEDAARRAKEMNSFSDYNVVLQIRCTSSMQIRCA